MTTWGPWSRYLGAGGKIIRRAWKAGVVLCGLSAGMICWFAASVTDSFWELAALPDGLGLISASACPHYDGDPNRRPRYQQLIASGFPAGYAADDGAALHFTGDDELPTAVSSRPTARAFKVHLVNGEVKEEALPMRYLGTL